MAHVLTTNSGENVILMDFRDFTDLVERHIGIEARDWLLEYLGDAYGEEPEIDAVIDEYENERDRHKQVMEEIRKEAEKLAGLIRERELNRSAISQTAGRIGSITWREVNRY